MGEDDAGNVDPEEETVKKTTQQLCHRMSVTSQVEPPKRFLGGFERNPGQGELFLFSLLVKEKPRHKGGPAVRQRPLSFVLMPQCLHEVPTKPPSPKTPAVVMWPVRNFNYRRQLPFPNLMEKLLTQTLVMIPDL